MALTGISVGKGKTGQKSLGLPSLNHFRGLWALHVISSCLEPGPGIIKVEKYCLLGCKGLTEKVWLWIRLVCTLKACPSRSLCYL